MSIEETIKKVECYLAKEEVKMSGFGSALPGYTNPNIKLQIQNEITQEYDFGWVFFYNTTKFIETGDFRNALAGNVLLIVNKISGDLIEAGTAKDISYYIDNYIKSGDPHREL